MKGHNIFISWSGERSQGVAIALKEWLPTVISSAKPWVSDTDVDKGSRALHEISRALEGIRIGIACLTPENLQSLWIAFEAGAVTKAIDDQTRLCTYLLGGLRFPDVNGPLGMFQHTKPEEEDTRKLVHTINRALNDEPIPESRLDWVFRRMWPDLAEKLQKMPAMVVAERKREVYDVVVDILELTRAEANRKKRTDFMDQYIPVLQELMPYLSEFLRARGPSAAPSGTVTVAEPIMPPPRQGSGDR